MIIRDPSPTAFKERERERDDNQIEFKLAPYREKPFFPPINSKDYKSISTIYSSWICTNKDKLTQVVNFEIYTQTGFLCTK